MIENHNKLLQSGLCKEITQKYRASELTYFAVLQAIIEEIVAKDGSEIACSCSISNADRTAALMPERDNSIIDGFWLRQRPKIGITPRDNGVNNLSLQSDRYAC